MGTEARLRLAPVLVPIALLLAAGCSSQSPGNAPEAAATASNVTLTAAQRQHVQIATVAATTFRRSIETTGVVDFDNDQATSVLAPFSGPVSHLVASLGERVSKGQELATVSSPDFAAVFAAYRKALATAATARRLADLDKDLLQHQGVAEREEEQAQTDAANAESDRAAALQALLALDVDPQTIKDIQDNRPVARLEGTIRSPIAGIVVEKLITPGQLVAAGTTPCFTVADLSRVWVQAQIFGADVAAIHDGDSADVDSDIAATHLHGTVTNVAALVDPDTRSVIARVTVTNTGQLLKKQMYVRVLIHSQHEDTGLLIPVSAILRDDENLPFVYLEQSDGSFARRHVTLGYRDGDRYEIPTGLKAGEKVVVAGGIFVRFIQSQ
ncbi:MAG TPA: efflux RND transporter periplasmic adaptor subunit [Steroidobacteraceae bacterium]|jgi:cobalt-zinc-cadmium efflux system membrane fusion protein|nr:efflux RND transporter periplasmic adaptor subunit [Steroidobacteraceae bacterium]